MENYPSYSYPDSGNSSPRSREIDFENPPPSWEENSLPQNYKVKFMVSYNGKIQPRSHDKLLAYTGGETKILSVDHNIKFSSIYSKLASFISPDETPLSGFTFKYQLPGEDLDALISVTNDDDLEHMLHEFDRMWKSSSKPARLRLFLFPEQQLRISGGSAFSSTSSDTGKLERGSDKDGKFADTLTSSQRIHQQHNHQNDQNNVVLDLPPPQVVSPYQPISLHSNDFLYGLDNKVPIQVPGPIPSQFPVRVHEPEMAHELNRLQISAHELFQMQQQQQQQSAIYPPKNDKNCADPNQKITSLANITGNIHAPRQILPGNWKQVEHHHQQNQQKANNLPNISANIQPQPQMLQYQIHQPQHKPVYMMHTPLQGNMLHAPPMMQTPPQGNMYQVQQQRIPSEQVYKEQPVYSTPASVAAINPVAIPAVSMAAPAQVIGGLSGENMGYTQVAINSATGRQVYYAAGQQCGVLTPLPFSGIATTVVSSGDLRSSGDVKVVQKGVHVPSSTVV